MKKNDTLTRVPGIKVGHYTDVDAITGCTVVRCPPKTVGAVDVRGGAPGTRETDMLQAHNLVEEVTAVLLSGGSAFGLASADGVMRWHVERGLGYQSRSGVVVPIVPAAILFDLTIGEPGVRPDAAAGYQACEAATSDPVPMGSVGAGTGARVAAIRGDERASKGGIGSAAITLPGGLVVAALMAVNAVGNVIDENGQIIAGLRSAEGKGFDSVLAAMIEMMNEPSAVPADENTVIGVVATNGELNKAQAQKVAQMAHDGLARAVSPSHTMFDGDTIFALATGQVAADPTVAGACAAEMVALAIRRAVRHATTLGGVRAISDG
ncbi:MAG: P1 family peptidase [Chloroflexota bacterium]|nr:P1 family peptidase [Chloroflexota bacterium]MDE2948365.1 P1 family peptidase [Chloroflexota bacterium]